MTDAQLSLLLLSLLDDLENTLQEVRNLLPEDAERGTVEHWRVKEEYSGEPFAHLQMNKGEFYIELGEYAALQPILSYIDRWRERVKVLSGEVE